MAPAAAATGTDSPVASFTRKPRSSSSRHRLSQLQHDLYLLLSRKLPLQAIRSRYDKHRPSRRQRRLLLLALALAAFATAYEFSTPFRHAVIAVERCAVIGWAVLRAVVDYKLLFRKEWPETVEGHAQRHQDYEDTHWKAAHRLMEALRQLGGIYIKVSIAQWGRKSSQSRDMTDPFFARTNASHQLGQHLSTVQLIPAPWAEAMRPLQDQCFPTPLDELQALFLAETGAPMTYFFSSFDPDPIGVASLAQVHKAVERESGRMVAVKCMHPHLEECVFDFPSCMIDSPFPFAGRRDYSLPKLFTYTDSPRSTCKRPRSCCTPSSASSRRSSLPGSAKRWSRTSRSRWTFVRVPARL